MVVSLIRQGTFGNPIKGHTNTILVVIVNISLNNINIETNPDCGVVRPSRAHVLSGRRLRAERESSSPDFGRAIPSSSWVRAVSEWEQVNQYTLCINR